MKGRSVRILPNFAKPLSFIEGFAMQRAAPVPGALQPVAGARLLLGCALTLEVRIQLFDLDLAWFVQHQAGDATIALRIVDGRHFSLMGQMARGNVPSSKASVPALFTVALWAELAVLVLGLLTLGVQPGRSTDRPRTSH
jgi:hypothetical protein